MRQSVENRLIDLMDGLDLSLLEQDCVERDLQNEELAARAEGSRWSRRRIAVVSGLAAAGSLALTGAAVLLVRRREIWKRALRHAA